MTGSEALISAVELALLFGAAWLIVYAWHRATQDEQEVPYEVVQRPSPHEPLWPVDPDVGDPTVAAAADVDGSAAAQLADESGYQGTRLTLVTRK